ncbi:MAG: radical SAM protein [Marinifilaceae bacterium]|nr:radical SAM protein [Marinifilaceae bacterium]
MATFLFDKIIFGPIQSRRLGVSLGINLLPTNHKICSFDCVYCECGLNEDKPEQKLKLVSAELVAEKLIEKLNEMKAKNTKPDVITFAGNGEPSLHPEFKTIIENTIKIRDEITPNTRIAVLSNATMIHKTSVFEALNIVDDNILKLDGGIEETIKLIDQPVGSFSLEKTVELLKRFNSNLIIQTMFIRGTNNNKEFDNTTEEEVKAWIDIVKQINPKQVMIYSIARDTPIKTLEKIEKDELNKIKEIAENNGIDTIVS